MTQERTEQTEECYFCHGSGKKIVIGEPDIVNAVDCPVCKGSEIDRLNATITGQAEAIREQTAKVQERDKEIERLRAVLAWYADPMNYIKQIGLDFGFQREFQPRVNSDNGKRANAALKGAE